MNEPDFENELRAIRPANPRRALEDRIASALTPAPATATLDTRQRAWIDRMLPAFGWGALGAITAVMAMLVINLTRGNTGQPVVDVPAKLVAAAEADVEMEHEVLNVADGGIVEDNIEGLSRVLRYESVERRRWKEKDGSVTVVEVPREDVVLVPITFQ